MKKTLICILVVCILSALVTVYAAEDIKAADGVNADHYKTDELVGKITTDDEGIAQMHNLWVGRYYVKK